MYHICSLSLSVLFRSSLGISLTHSLSFLFCSTLFFLFRSLHLCCISGLGVHYQSVHTASCVCYEAIRLQRDQRPKFQVCGKSQTYMCGACVRMCVALYTEVINWYSPCLHHICCTHIHAQLGRALGSWFQHNYHSCCTHDLLGTGWNYHGPSSTSNRPRHERNRDGHSRYEIRSIKSTPCSI